MAHFYKKKTHLICMSEYIELDDIHDKDDFDSDLDSHSYSNFSSLHTSFEEKSRTVGLIPETDDPSIPSLTLRSILIGTLFNIFLSISNAIFSFRTTSFAIPSFIATLLSYPMGIFLASVIPSRRFRFIIDWNTNDGNFSIKEHVLIYIIASGGAGIPYGLDNVVTQRMDMFMGNKHITFLESLMWVLASQFIGFGMAGIMRRFLVFSYL